MQVAGLSIIVESCDKSGVAYTIPTLGITGWARDMSVLEAFRKAYERRINTYVLLSAFRK